MALVIRAQAVRFAPWRTFFGWLPLLLAAALALPGPSAAAAQVATRAKGAESSQQRAQDRQAADEAPASPQPAPPPALPWHGVLLAMGISGLMARFGLVGPAADVAGLLLLLALPALVALLMFRLRRARSGPAYGEDGGPVYAGDYSPDDLQPGRDRSGRGRSGRERSGSGRSGRDRSEPAAHDPAAVQPAKGGDGGGRPQGSASPAGPARPSGGGRRTAAPADFSEPQFLRSAKDWFMRLQRAWDAGDLADIRDFTRPEVAVELKSQLKTRGAQENVTAVVALEAVLVSMEVLGNVHLVRVKFTGQAKDGSAGRAKPFIEVWSMSRPTLGKDGWMLAGIEQYTT